MEKKMRNITEKEMVKEKSHSLVGLMEKLLCFSIKKILSKLCVCVCVYVGVSGSSKIQYYRSQEKWLRYGNAQGEAHADMQRCFGNY